MKLREYQEKCVLTVDELPDGSRSIVAMATGLGKTLTAANFKAQGRVLWLSHRDELVRQPENYFMEQGRSFGIEKAKDRSHGEDIVSASVQSLVRRLVSFTPEDFDLIVIDEAHHAVAPSYKKIIDYFHPRKLIGLTATPRRGDGIALGLIFDSICFSRDLRWGIENGYLADIRCLRVKADFLLGQVRKNDKDFSLASLGAAMEESENASLVAKVYVERCREKRTLIFTPTVSTCYSVLYTIQKLLPESEKTTLAVLTGTSDIEYRREMIDRYKKGDILAIINCGVLTEGVDLPSTEIIINDRPTANAVLYEQMIGRGIRLAEGKDSCLIIDIVSRDWREKKICTAPSLFGFETETVSPYEDEIQEISEEQANEDIEEVVEKTAELNAKIASQLALIFEKGDPFFRTIMDDVEKKKRTGCQALAYAIKRQNTALSIEAEETGLYIHASHRDSYKQVIRCSYDEQIWLTDPDEEGRVTARFELGMIRAISEPLEEKELFRLIAAYLEKNARGYKNLWSCKNREKWEKQKASGRQIEYLNFLFYTDFGRCDIGQLSKQEAGDLIAWKLDQIAAEKIKKREEKWLEKERGRMDDDEYRQWVEEVQKKQIEDEDRKRREKAAWPRLLEKIKMELK